jgi:hypothetical protein
LLYSGVVRKPAQQAGVIGGRQREAIGAQLHGAILHDNVDRLGRTSLHRADKSRQGTPDEKLTTRNGQHGVHPSAIRGRRSLLPISPPRYTDKFDDPSLPGEMQVTVTSKKVSVGTELDIVQAGVPDVIPPKAPGGTTLKHHLGPAAARWHTGSPRKLEPRRPQVCTRFPRKRNSPAQRQMAQNRLLRLAERGGMSYASVLSSTARACSPLVLSSMAVQERSRVNVPATPSWRAALCET